MIRLLARVLGWSLSFRLWRALWERMPEYPLMDFAVKRTSIDTGAVEMSSIIIAMIVAGFIPVLWAVGFGVALAAVFIGGTLRGIVAAALTARSLRQERDFSRIDLLGLTPGGQLGTGWTLAIRAMRRSEWGKFADRYILNAQRVLAVGVLVMGGMCVLGGFLMQLTMPYSNADGEQFANWQEAAVPLLTWGLSLSMWLVTDNAQSPLIGALIGIYGGMTARRKIEAAFTGAALYILLQLVMVIVLIAAWQTGIGLWDGTAFGFGVLIVIVLREIVLRLIWGYLRVQLNANGMEIAVVTRF